jgi:hypothetical protein
MQRVALGCKYKVVASGWGALPLRCIVDFIKMSQASRERVEVGSGKRTIQAETSSNWLLEQPTSGSGLGCSLPCPSEPHSEGVDQTV